MSTLRPGTLNGLPDAFNSLRRGRNSFGAPLVFVFLGTDFPSYGAHSIKIAKETSGLPIILLSSTRPRSNVLGSAIWVPIDSFYDAQDFEIFAKKSPYSADFRDGFWHKTAERFFVLRAFMDTHGIGTAFHGELDCLFIRLNDFENQLMKTGFSGTFLPRETEDRCVASLVYVNSLKSLDSLCKYLLENSDKGNEMDILGSLPLTGSSEFHYFPTAEFFFRDEAKGGISREWALTPANSDFVVDGAVIGRWLLGVDPRNTGGRGTRNRLQRHRYGVPFDYPLSSLSFIQSRHNPWEVAVVGPTGATKKLAVIHVHSKIHAKLTPWYFTKILSRLSLGKSTQIVGIHPHYVLSLLKRIARHARIVLSSPVKIKAQIRKARSPSWWSELPKRVL